MAKHICQGCCGIIDALSLFVECQQDVHACLLARADSAHIRRPGEQQGYRPTREVCRGCLHETSA